MRCTICQIKENLLITLLGNHLTGGCLMKSKGVTMVFLMFGLLLSPLTAALAGEILPPGNKPLSLILKSVEERKLGSITEAEFEDGLWEVKICGAAACQKLYLDPRTGDEKRRRKTDSDEIPLANAMSISTIIQSIEARGMGTVIEVDFDDGFWEVELRKDRQKMKLVVDPMTGETRR
ncbi:MAG: PepSY domain-containing protein [Candidatus Brocadia sp.]|nr:PepSY domain-containing protein [Candidatus Brocadia sp.]